MPVFPTQRRVVGFACLAFRRYAVSSFGKILSSGARTKIMFPASPTSPHSLAAFQPLRSQASRRVRQRFCKKRANTDRKRKNCLNGKSKFVGNPHAVAIASNRLVTSATRFDVPSMRGKFSGKAS